MSHEDHHEHCHFKVCMKVAKLVLQAATVAAGVCIAKEIHKVHKSIERRK